MRVAAHSYQIVLPVAKCPARRSPQRDRVMPEEIIDHRDFCQRLIEFLADCPYNNPNPITAVCPCYALSSDSSSCLRGQRRARAARDFVAAVPLSTANP